MTQFIGSAGSEIISGTVGLADEFVTAAAQNALEFRWNGTSSWIVTGGGQGTDTLTSVETITMADAAFTLGVGGETRANTTNTTTYASSVVGLSDGGHLVLWHMTATADGSGFGVFAQRYDAAGEPVGGETRINTTTLNAQQDAVGVALSSGRYAVIWTSSLQDGSGFGVYMQRFNAAGAPLGGETLVNATTANSQYQPAVTQLANGSFVVSWTSDAQDGSGSGVYFQRFSVNGVVTGPETLVNTTTAGAQDEPSVATLGSGFVVVWSSAGQDGSADGVYFQRFSANGSPLGGETLVNTIVSGNQYMPAVSSTPSGFLVVWYDSSSADVRGQMFDTAGMAVGTEFVVNSTIANTQYEPTVTALADGGYAVAWTGYNTVNATYEIYVQRLSATGEPLGPETTVNWTLPGTQGQPSIAALADGGFVVGWTGAAPAFSQRFTADGLPVLPSLTGDLNNNTLSAASGTTPVELDGGEGNDLLTGGSAADRLVGGLGHDTLRGRQGDDYYIADAHDRVIEGFDAGIDTVQVGESFALGRNIENLVLVGDAAARLLGNDLNNTLTGNDADNVLNGRGGADTMRGGRGNDSYFADSSSDTVIENADGGIDTVVSEASYVLGANVENLRLSGAFEISATGNALDNRITGNAGANQLDGGAGADRLIGGGGNDSYIADALDQLFEDELDGIDTVIASASWVLGANFENLTLGGSAHINGTGNELANTIYGNGGNNVLDGGAGSDSLNGGEGDDTYLVDNSGDVAGDGGTSTGDTVLATVSHVLGFGIENLTLLGSADLNGDGNTLDNVVRGNSGANYLFGSSGSDRLYGGLGGDLLQGGIGTDTLYGGGGNDTYLVTDDGDEIVELRDQGIDTVEAAVATSYALEINVENLLLVGSHVAGYGNALDNELTGTAGNNLLDGGGGADRLTGLLGNDTYVVDSADDVVIEVLDEGTDQVLSSVSATLTANVENLALTGSAQIDGTGNVLRNLMIGNDARNVIGGGDGNDRLIGEGGNDSLSGDAGNDVLDGGTGDDLMNGGLGTDTVSYALTAGGVTVSLAIGVFQNTVAAGSDRLVAIENLEGSNSGDVLTGNAAANRLDGNGGNDTLTGADGNDQLHGGEGDDLVLADAGNDQIDGGNGIDVLSFAAIAGAVTVDLSVTESQNTGAGIDTIRNVETIIGSDSGNDTLTGDHNANSLSGLSGSDTLAGGEGADVLDGGASADTASYALAYGDVHVDLGAGFAFDDGFGTTDTLIAIERLIGSEFDDTLTGNGVNNWITGGLGRDVMTGNGGDDVFILRAADDSGLTETTRDVMTDFSAGDLINLSPVDADTVSAGNNDFSTVLAAGSAFTAAGQLMFEDGILYGNTDTDAAAEFSIELAGVTSMTMADFIL